MINSYLINSHWIVKCMKRSYERISYDGCKGTFSAERNHRRVRDDLWMTPESIGSHSELRSIPAALFRTLDTALLNALLLG